MSRLDLLALIGQGVAGGVAGLLLGRAYFAHLRQATQRLLDGASPIVASLAGAMAGGLVRIAGALFVFLVLARWGAAPAVCGLTGFTLARPRSTGERSERR